MSDITEIVSAIREFDHAMLVTRRDRWLRSRPMAIGDVTNDGRIRFITHDNSGKMSELDVDSAVNVVMQSDSSFLSISGTARQTKDRKLIEAAWQESQEPWFSRGCDDPHVIVVEVIPTYAEYWNRNAADLVSTIFGAAGNDDIAGEHREVDFSGRPL